MNSPLDIFVVAYRARKELANTLASISLFTEPGYRLTVYENGANNYPLTWLWNRFLSESGRPYVAICNPDIIVGPGWDTESLACLEHEVDVGAVQPFTNCGQHNDIFGTPGVFPRPMRIDDVPAVTERIRAEFADRRYLFSTKRDVLFGHCYILRRATWKELGGFDEKFEFGGNEYDFNDRLLLQGKRLAICGHAFAYHVWNASSKEAKERNEWDAARGQPLFKAPPAGRFGEI